MSLIISFAPFGNPGSLVTTSMSSFLIKDKSALQEDIHQIIWHCVQDEEHALLDCPSPALTELRKRAPTLFLRQL